MSKRDVQEFEQQLAAFHGCYVDCSMACNSLKLWVGRNLGQLAAGYIWMDPPWTYSISDRVIQTAESCPDADQSDYEGKFAAWSQRMRALEGKRLLNHVIAPDGALTIVLSGGQQILVPATSEGCAESWHDHWYASTNNSPAQLIAAANDPAPQATGRG
jgi:hypothetical protein